MKQYAGKIWAIVLIVVGLIVVNVLAERWNAKWDFTDDQRFTLSPTTLDLVDAISQPVMVTVYLTGDFPAIFTRLEKNTRSILTQMSRKNPNIMVRYDNPSVGTVEEVNRQREEFVNNGLVPVRLTIKEESTEKLIFPYALVQFGMKRVYVSLLESERAGVPNDQTIARSTAMLEYKFTSSLMRLFQERKKNVVFTAGHGELTMAETADWERSLHSYFNTSRVNLDSIVAIPPRIDVLVIAKPTSPFSEQDKFKIDQYLMRGGRLIFLLDKMNVSEDSLRMHGQYVSTNYDLNLDDLLFKYGIRIQSNLILSLENTRRPMVVGQMGGENQYELFPWYYYLAAIPAEDFPVTKGLDRIQLKYASVIEPLESPMRKTALLRAGTYARYQFNPVDISLDIVRYEPDITAFSHSNLAMAYMVEGEFESLYQNRVTPGMNQGLDELGMSFQDHSEYTQIMVVSDGDIARNGFDAQRRQPQPLGFDPYENYTFDNKSFLNNAVEYMTGMGTILPLRAKKMEMRLLDQQTVAVNKTWVQAVNSIFPIAAMLLLSLIWRFFRKRKYTRV
ncbi:MAG TPA: gliding motility-associated ABC transporter substrate-binding protein GldG [Membranihabitans sp.]|nr:gliding motility-associated ABC transporter substrate-binding protein GldG [Membranihabitans sp.]